MSTLADIFTALKNHPVAIFKLDINEDGNYRANLGDDQQAFVESAALNTLAEVEDFFRAQIAIHFPDITLE